jgi:hypothetical protein
MKNAIEVLWVDGMPYVFFTFFGCRTEEAEEEDGGGEGDGEVLPAAGTAVYGRSCRITFLLSFAVVVASV